MMWHPQSRHTKLHEDTVDALVGMDDVLLPFLCHFRRCFPSSELFQSGGAKWLDAKGVTSLQERKKIVNKFTTGIWFDACAKPLSHISHLEDGVHTTAHSRGVSTMGPVLLPCPIPCIRTAQVTVMNTIGGIELQRGRNQVCLGVCAVIMVLAFLH
jgi:hypothetical protein